MATQITAWKSSDGSIHLNQQDAIAADARDLVDDLADALADAVCPAYTSSEDIKRGLLSPDGCALVLKLAAGITALHALQETT